MRKNVLARLFRGLRRVFSSGIWMLMPVLYICWLMSRIMVLKIKNTELKMQLSLSKTVKDQTAVGSLIHYEVPKIQNASRSSVCENIHVAFVCTSKCPRVISPMLKSLLHRRQNPLHFHLLVDTTSSRTMSHLFDTWDLPDVKYTCYNIESHLTRVRWIPTRHSAGVYAMVKLLYPDMLPNAVSKVIVLDSDLTIVSDISELWEMFGHMIADQMIGLVGEQSNFYFEKNKWPALARGYNTGVMLLDLHKIRTHTNWTALWQEALHENLPRLKTTILAEQDVINAMIKKHPGIVYDVSCQYNLITSVNNLAKKCYGVDQKKVKIIHWASQTKHNAKTQDADYFRIFHRLYLNFDGYLLRKKLQRCWKAQVDIYKVNRSDPCADFRAAQRVKLRTHVYFMDYKYSNADSFDVTLVLQLSMDRLQFLGRLLKHWEGPVSATIYLADGDVNRLESFIRDGANTLRGRKNIGYHLVFKHQWLHYPVNYLRNVALENVNTPYVFLMDADFVPMVGLYDHLRAAIKLVNPYPQKKCLVVPAFEAQGYRASPPRSKAALLARLAGGDVAPFRAREWARRHRATNYSRWASAAVPYEVEWQSDYEPYLVVHRSVPKYDTRFSEFDWNKVSHMVELRAQGYKAVVLPGAFVVHTTHAPSADIYKKPRNYRSCLTLLQQEFLNDVKRKYNLPGAFQA